MRHHVTRKMTMRSMWNRCAMDDVLEKWALLQVSFASCRSWSLELVTNWIIESLTLPIISCTANALHVKSLTIYQSQVQHIFIQSEESRFREISFHSGAMLTQLLSFPWPRIHQQQWRWSNNFLLRISTRCRTVRLFLWDVWLEGSRSLHWSFIESRLLPAAGFQVVIILYMLMWSNMILSYDVWSDMDK